MKTDKSIYQKEREKAGLSRHQVSTLTGYISESRLEKIESRKSPVQPAKLVDLENCYGCFGMAYGYCQKECAIGHRYALPADCQSLEKSLLKALQAKRMLDQLEEKLIAAGASSQISDEMLELVKEAVDVLEQLGAAGLEMSFWVQMQEKKQERKEEGNQR